MRKRLKSESKVAAEASEAQQHMLTVQENESLRHYLSRMDEETMPKLRVVKDSGAIVIDYPDRALGRLLLISSFGTSDPAFATHIILELILASTEGTQLNETKFNAMLAMVTSRKPRDEYEASLAMIAAMTHFALVKIGRQLGAAKTLMQQKLLQPMYSSLSETYMKQMKLLDREEAGGENSVTLQQKVTVSDGSQAAVYTQVTNAKTLPADVNPEAPVASPLALSDAKAMPMKVIEETAAVPEKVERYRSKRS